MPKPKIEYHFQFNYNIVAISTPLKDYRVSFFINNDLNIALQKEEDLVIDNRSKSQSYSFEMQYYNDLVNDREYFLILNKSKGVYFLPSLKKFDFLFFVKTERTILIQEKLIETLKKNRHFQIVYNVGKLSAKESNMVDKNLIYEKP